LQTVLDFSLSDQVYARARVSDVASVNLWLGAGVMLEYPLGEAQALLERQLVGCKQQLKVVQWEHEYIKDQLTTTEVRGAGGEGCVGVCARWVPRIIVHANWMRVLCSMTRHALADHGPYLLQVSMARVYNWDVQNRRAAAAASS
jgi:hypothetical protein